MKKKKKKKIKSHYNSFNLNENPKYKLNERKFWPAKKRTERVRAEQRKKIMFNIFIRCYNKIVIINNFSDEHQREFLY